MDLTKKITSWFLAVAMALGLISQTVFAQEPVASLLQYETTQQLNEEGTEATISIKFTQSEKIELEKITLPDGTELTGNLAEISYVAPENGHYEFKTNYSMNNTPQEEIIPVEVTELSNKKTEGGENLTPSDLLSVNGNTYEVSTADQFKTALSQIESSQDIEATIVLAADIENQISFVGIAGKSITVKSIEGQKYTLPLGNYLEGDITIDNVNVYSGTLYCNGHRTIFTENCEFSIGSLFGGADQQNVDSVYVKINGKGVINSGGSELVITGGCYKGSVNGDLYMEIDGDIDIKASVGGHYISGGSKETRYGGDTYHGDPLYVNGDLTFILGLNNVSSAHNLCGTHNTHVKGDLNLIVKHGTFIGIDGQRENPERAIVDGNINMTIGDPNEEQPVYVTWNWGIVGAGEKIANSDKLYQVGKDVNITTYENVWCWEPGQDPGSDIGGLTGAESAVVEGNININVNGSHLKDIVGIDTGMYYNDPTIKGNINIVANDADLNSPYTECIIHPTEDDTYLNGDANITMNGGRANRITALDGTIYGKVNINITGNPTITHDVIGKNVTSDSPNDESVLNIDQGTVTIPQGIWYFKTTNISNHSDVTLGNNNHNALKSGIYDLFVNHSSLTTNNQAYSLGSLYVNNGELTTNGPVFITGLTNTNDSNIHFNDYTALGYGYKSDSQHDQNALISQNDTISFGPNTSLNLIYGNASFIRSQLNIYSWLKIFGDYQGNANAIDMYAYSGDSNYPDATIKLEILGKTAGVTDVNLVKYGNVTEEGLPVVGQNYINALTISEDTFELANKNAKENGLYFKKVTDADTVNKANYDMWQVAKRDGYGVIYSFESETSGKELPQEVMNLLPQDTTTYHEGDTVTAKKPTQLEVQVSDGVWKFVKYDAESKIANANHANDDGVIQFIGTWTFQKSGNPDKPVDPDKPTDPDKPVDPDKPTDPDRPVDPDKPTDPDRPVDPNKPTNPDRPTNPEKPADPNRPTDPSKPNTPSNPNQQNQNKPTQPGSVGTATRTNLLFSSILLLVSGICALIAVGLRSHKFNDEN